MTSAQPATVAWAGEVDVAAVPSLRTRLTEALTSDPRPVRLIIDLDDVTFIDSRGIGLLVETKYRCDDLAVDFTVRNVPEHTRRLMIMTGLREVFDLPA